MSQMALPVMDACQCSAPPAPCNVSAHVSDVDHGTYRNLRVQSAQPVEDSLSRATASNAANDAVKLEGLNSVEGQVDVLALRPVHSLSVNFTNASTYNLFQYAASWAWNTLGFHGGKGSPSKSASTKAAPEPLATAVTGMAFPGSTAVTQPCSRASARSLGSGNDTPSPLARTVPS